MYKMIMNSLLEWNQTNNERVKLQHAYVISAIALIVLAGLIGLVNYELGQQMTAVALLALAIFFVNLITWTLLHGIVLMRLGAEAEKQKSAVSSVKKPARKKTVRKTNK